MKKSVLFLLLICFGFQAFSQSKLNKISVNPVQLFLLNITNFEYERGFKEGKLGVSFYYGATGRAIREIGGYSISSTEQNVSLKSYSKSMQTSSFWYGGQLSVASATIYGKNDFYNRNSAYNIGTLGLSGKLGYQFIVKSFYLDLYGGLGFALTNNLFGKARYYGSVKETNLLLNYGVKLGIVF